MKDSMPIARLGVIGSLSVKAVGLRRTVVRCESSAVVSPVGGFMSAMVRRRLLFARRRLRVVELVCPGCWPFANRSPLRMIQQVCA